MRRIILVLLVVSILICSLSVSVFAYEVGNDTVELYYWNEDRTAKTAFAGSSALLDEERVPFKCQLKVFLSEPIAPGDYVDLEISFSATEGFYSIDLIEASTSDEFFLGIFEYSYVEIDSNHVRIEGLYITDEFDYSIGILWINYSVIDPAYTEQTTVINGTPTKQYGFTMSVNDITVSGIGESGFWGRILAGILDLPNLLVRGIKNLFLPSQEDALAFRDKVDALLRERLGAAYEANDIIEDFAYSFSSGSTAATLEEDQEPATITFPELTVNLAGADFTFGGWEVQIIPDGFEPIVEILKNVVNMVCTLVFLNGLKGRLEGFFH